MVNVKDLQKAQHCLRSGLRAILSRRTKGLASVTSQGSIQNRKWIRNLPPLRRFLVLNYTSLPGSIIFLWYSGDISVHFNSMIHVSCSEGPTWVVQGTCVEQQTQTKIQLGLGLWTKQPSPSFKKNIEDIKKRKQTTTGPPQKNLRTSENLKKWHDDIDNDCR